jgi:myo-inositol 2-dehydrogenase/D-chiro-inositol 1-dehydrogenase/scyllo-inositol 2-dehydrogenase (NAD+)
MIAVSDVMEESARAAAAELGVSTWYTDYREALNNPAVDAVIVVTPTKFHCQIVDEAARAKKHILCEKPMAMNREECQKMIGAAKENGVKLQIGFMRRFDDNFRRAKEIIASGAIGEVVTVKSVTHGPSTPREWMYDIGKSNGPLAEVSSHDIDSLRWLSGSEAESLYAIAGNYRCREVQAAYPDFYDTVLVNLRMKNGVLGNIDGAQGVQYGYDARVEVTGTNGAVHIGSLSGNNVLTFTKDHELRGDVVRSWTNLFHEAYVNEDIAFVEAVRNNTETLVTGLDGMMAVDIVRAGNESIKTGQIVKL